MSLRTHWYGGDNAGKCGATSGRHPLPTTTNMVYDPDGESARIFKGKGMTIVADNGMRFWTDMTCRKAGCVEAAQREAFYKSLRVEAEERRKLAPSLPLPRSMPDGSMDWRWWYEEYDKAEERDRQGLCVGGCGQPQQEGRVTCDAPSARKNNCPGTRPFYVDWSAKPVCSYCGKVYSGAATNASSGSGPFHPVPINRCPDCLGKRRPPREEAVGVLTLFD